MKLSSWYLLICSAILYALQFIFPSYLWWLGFVFPIPLFYVATKETLGLKEGALFGVISINMHLLGVLIGIDHFTSADDGLIRLIPGIGCILYTAFLGACWAWITTQIKKILSINTPSATIALWTIALWCYIFFFDRMCLWPGERIEGYFGFHPLVPLAIQPQLLALIPIFGKNLLALLMYLVPATITLFLIQRNLRNFLLIILACLPWCIALLMPIKEAPIPLWLRDVVAFPAIFPGKYSSDIQAQIAQDHFRMIEQENTRRNIILLPESSFQCDHLSTKPDLCELWSEEYLGKPMHIILGTFRWDKSEYRNSLHWIYNGKIKGIFDKRHVMTLLERIPEWLDFKVLRQLFFKYSPQIMPSQVTRPCFKLEKDIELVPYICSELFFNEHPDDNYSDTPILAITNDLWGITLYVSQLMYLNARLKAILWNRDIIYISYKYAAYLDRWGNETPLPIIIR